MSVKSISGITDDGNVTSFTTVSSQFQAFRCLYNAYKESNSENSENVNYHLIHNAAASGDLKLLKWIIKHTKCSITDQDDDGLTILHVASLTSNFDIVDWILKNTHVSPVIRTTEGATSLHFAAWTGNLDIAKRLVENEPRLINMRMVNGTTAAFIAAQGGFLDVMEYFLNQGANFGLTSVDGINCLHIAAQQSHLDVVKWLVEVTGLSVNSKDDHGANPIHYAAINKRNDTVKWLLSKEVNLLKDRFDSTPHKTADDHDVSFEALDTLVKSKTNPSAVNLLGLSALSQVQERLNSILSNKDKYPPSETGECKISLNVLLLLQSALGDLRQHYHGILTEYYQSDSQNQKSLFSKETQTDGNSLENQTEASENVATTTNIPAPPAPPPAPSPLSSQDTTNSIINNIRESAGRRRKCTDSSTIQRGSSTDDIRVNLIQELKQINTLRNRNINSHFYQDDELSLNSSSDSQTDKSPMSTFKSSNAESVPNIFTLFNNGSPTGSNTSSVQKAKEDFSKQNNGDIPQWKKEILEKRQQSPKFKNREAECSLTPTRSPNGTPSRSKVGILVNQWQATV